MSKSSFSTIISTAKHPLSYKKENSNTYTNTNFSSNYNKSEYDEDKNSCKQNNSISSHNSESFNKNFKELKLRYEKRISTKKSKCSNTINDTIAPNNFCLFTAEENKENNFTENKNLVRFSSIMNKKRKSLKEISDTNIIKEILIEENDSINNSKNKVKKVLNKEKCIRKNIFISDNTLISKLKIDPLRVGVEANVGFCMDENKIGKRSLKNPLNIRVSKIYNFDDIYHQNNCNNRSSSLSEIESCTDLNYKKNSNCSNSKDKVNPEYINLKGTTFIDYKDKLENNKLIKSTNDNDDKITNLSGDIFVNNLNEQRFNNIYYKPKKASIDCKSIDTKSKNSTNILEESTNYLTPESSKFNQKILNDNVFNNSSLFGNNYYFNSNGINRKISAKLIRDKDKIEISSKIIFKPETNSNTNQMYNNNKQIENMNQVSCIKTDTSLINVNTKISQEIPNNSINLNSINSKEENIKDCNHRNSENFPSTYYNNSKNNYYYKNKYNGNNKNKNNNDNSNCSNYRSDLLSHNQNINDSNYYNNDYNYTNNSKYFQNNGNKKDQYEIEEFIINFYSNKTNLKRKYETNEIDIEKILDFTDCRTTVMIKNIPNKYTLDDLIDEIDDVLKNSYTYINLPLDYSVSKYNYQIESFEFRLWIHKLRSSLVYYFFFRTI